MRNDQVICDVCGRVKGEGNGWLIAISDPERPGAIAFGSAEMEPADQAFVVQDICGENCAHVRLSRALDKPMSTTTSEAA